MNFLPWIPVVIAVLQMVRDNWEDKSKPDEK